MSDTRQISRGPIDLLIDEHETLTGLFKAYEGLDPGHLQEKRDVLRKIEDAVARHVTIEEALFYPTLLELKDRRIHGRVAEAVAEHRMLEALLAELRDAGTDPKADLVTGLLRSCAKRHVEFEELNIFPFSLGLPRVTLNQLGLEIEERRSQGGAH